MKNLLCLFLSCVVLIALAGCRQSPAPGPRIAKLEDQWANLSLQLLEQEKQIAAQTAALREMSGAIRTNREFSLELIGGIGTALTDLEWQARRHFEDTVIHRTNAVVATRYAPAPVTKAKPTTEANTQGVPASVYKSIRTFAAERYPTDFDMQEYVVRQQIDAYRKLNP